MVVVVVSLETGRVLPRAVLKMNAHVCACSPPGDGLPIPNRICVHSREVFSCNFGQVRSASESSDEFLRALTGCRGCFHLGLLEARAGERMR